MGSNFGSEGIENDVSWVAAMLVENILNKGIVRNRGEKEGITYLWIIKGTAEWVH